jgi:hypothetical protein
MTAPNPKRSRGRPTLPDDAKAVRLNITLSRRAIAILDERGVGRAREIERLIIESATPPAPR